MSPSHCYRLGNRARRGDITPRHLIAAYAGLLLIGFAIGWVREALPWQDSIDYGRRPAREMFAQVVADPVPPGVSNIRAAGRSYLVTTRPRKCFQRWLWMRFDASDDAMRALVKSLARPELRVTEESAREAPKERISANDRY